MKGPKEQWNIISWFMLVNSKYLRSTYYVPKTMLIHKWYLLYRDWQSRTINTIWIHVFWKIGPSSWKLKLQCVTFPLYPKNCYQGFWNLQTTKYVNMKRLAWAPSTFWNTKLGYGGGPVLLSVTSWKSGTSPKVDSFSQKSIVLKKWSSTAYRNHYSPLLFSNRSLEKNYSEETWLDLSVSGCQGILYGLLSYRCQSLKNVKTNHAESNASDWT